MKKIINIALALSVLSAPLAATTASAAPKKDTVIIIIIVPK